VTIPDRIGKYQFERRLGNGGMAEVYLANTVGAEGFRRQVAIKRVLPGFSSAKRG
jgi:eukaryotic-like serine/threonine-protein kinase